MISHDDTLTAAHHFARKLKQNLVVAQGVGQDIAPTMVLQRGNTLLSCLYGPSLPALADVAEDAITCSGADAVVIFDEAYCEEASSAKTKDTPLSTRFATGDRDVREQVITWLITKDGYCRGAASSYTYEGRHLRWDRTEYATAATGPALDLIRLAFLSTPRTPPMEPAEFCSYMMDSHGLLASTL